MYIPSEAVYYEIVNSPDLFDLAGERRILPVSPMSFYAYMKAILMSFEGQKIEKQAKEILAMLNALKRDYDKTEEAITLMNKHVTNAYNQSNTVVRSFGALGQKLKTPHPLTGDTPAASLSESEEASRVTVAHSPAKSSVNRSGPVEPDIIT
jgi:DNA recombination protein RmuC